MSLAKQKSNISVIVTTFAFTMLGFLAAVITILFSFSSSKVFRKYKRKGHLRVFFYIYYLAIFSLVITFALGVLSLAESQGIWPMRLSLMSVVNNFSQISLLTVIIVNLSSKAAHEL